MRWLSWFVLMIGVATIAYGGEKFPYTAYVTSDEVFVRSGPGKNYYPTSKLTRGDAVEVYRLDPGGWCAIRPPRRSYSWVPSEALKIDRDGIATVLPEQLPARVGSAFGEMRDTTQVRLDRGELVEVIETHVMGEGPDRMEWSMITPPSGEFRWVSQKLLDRNPPEERDDSEERKPHRAPAELARNHRPADLEQDDKYNNVRQTAGEEDVRDSDRNWRKRDQDSAAASPPPRTKPGRKKSMTPEEAFQADLDEIDLELSVVVAEEPSSWRFDDLQKKADAVADRASTAVERGRAREMLNKLARFQDIKHRYDTVNSPFAGPVARDVNRLPLSGAPIAGGPQAGPASYGTPANPRQLTDPFRSGAPAPLPNSVTANTLTPLGAGTAAADTRFDGRGKLTKVVSQRPGAPRYALVDGSGQVTAFVSQGPGVNMEPYVGREVGVTGERGYMPEFKKTHVTALRVTLADPTAVR